MARCALITGGAGFIGSHLADRLLEGGWKVRVLDALVPQVHGRRTERPSYLSEDVDLIVGDLRERAKLRRAIQGVDTVFHLAAVVGVGQSMYQVARFTEANVLGTAALLEELAGHPLERLVLASGMHVYGEGAYAHDDGRVVTDVERTWAQLRVGHWDPRDEEGRPLSPLATSEEVTPAPVSVYGLTKLDQERLVQMLGRAHGLPTTVLRLAHVYGPRQSLSNPYTGVVANMASRLLYGRPPVIYEDGLQSRDFVHVEDAVRACVQVGTAPEAKGRTYNIGWGTRARILELAHRLDDVLGGRGIAPDITGRSRAGDVRNCFADVRAAREELGFEPRVPLHDGLCALADWLEGQAPLDRVPEARDELAARGLTL